MSYEDSLEQATKLYKPKLNLERLLFPEQLAFVKDTRKNITAVTSRRAGKTIGCAFDFLHGTQVGPPAPQLYITLSLANARRILWPDLTRLNRELGMGGVENRTDLSLTFKDGNVIYLSGAKDSEQIEKFRGMKFKKVYIDEAQSFRPYIEELIDDVIVKGLYDFNGQLKVTGTPGPIPTGYFHKISQSKSWAHHHWTLHKNHFLEKTSGLTAGQLIAQDCERKGVTVDDPAIQRECFGRWVLDENSLVFRYSGTQNDCDFVAQSKIEGWSYVLGVDIGFEDADAIATLGWSSGDPTCFLVEEKVARKQGISELVTSIEGLIKKYSPISVVMDEGGLGKKIGEELRHRYGLPVKAAEKSGKFAYIELLNDAMRTGKFKARKESQFAQDCMLVEWESRFPKPKISDSFHSDITDAVLYAYRDALSWLEVPEKVKPKVGTPEWDKAREEEFLFVIDERLRRQKEEEVQGWSWG